MALLMLVSFAACGGNDVEEETTTGVEETTEDAAVGGEIEDATDEDVTDEPETEVVTDESGEAVTDENGEAVTEEVTEKEEGTTKKTNSTGGATQATQAGEKPVSQWSKQEILDYYNAAVKKTDEKKPIKGNQKMVLGNDGKITGDGFLGAVVKAASPIIDKVLKNNSTEVDNIPGYGEIKLSDVKTIKASEKNGIVTVEMTIKEQTDGPTADGSAGPVGRAIGTLGNIDGALEQLGASFSRGKENVKLTYSDPSIKATINDSTGMITGGRWHYIVQINISDADIKLVLEFTAKNLNAAVDFTVTF